MSDKACTDCAEGGKPVRIIGMVLVISIALIPIEAQASVTDDAAHHTQPPKHTQREDVKRVGNFEIRFRADPDNPARVLFETRKFFTSTPPRDEELVVLIRIREHMTWSELSPQPLFRLAEGTGITETSPKMENGACHGFAFRHIGSGTTWLGMRGSIKKTTLERWAREQKGVEFVFNQHHNPPIPGPIPHIATFTLEPGAILRTLDGK